MNPSFGRDLTTGSIPRHLIQFALPILIGNLLATGYGIINAIWVGNLLGKEAVGAIAVSFPVFLVLVALCSGATLASSILVSKAYGAKNHGMIQSVVNHSWTLAIVMIGAVTAGGLLSVEPVLWLLGTPSAIMPLAVDYLTIMVAGFAFLYVSNLIAAVLRGIGDTMVPMIFMILSIVINAVLDPLLIMGAGPIPSLGLNGAAYASLIASGTATILGMFYVRRKYGKEPIHPTGLMYERNMIMTILKIGLPSFLQQLLVSLGYAFITVFVNLFGAASIAAFGIASRLDGIIAMPAMAIMMAVSTLTAQNLGAGKPERIKDVFRWGILVNIPVILLISLLCLSFPEMVMRLFVSDAEVIRAGIDYLRIVGAGYLFFILFYVSNGIIMGTGKTMVTMAISFVSLCVIRIPLAAWLSQTGLGIRGIWYAIVISFAVTAVVSLGYYLSGRWKREKATTAAAG